MLHQVLPDRRTKWARARLGRYPLSARVWSQWPRATGVIRTRSPAM